MKKQAFLILVSILCSIHAKSQSVKWSSDDVKALTPEWTGERTPMADRKYLMTSWKD